MHWLMRLGFKLCIGLVYLAILAALSTNNPVLLGFFLLVIYLIKPLFYASRLAKAGSKR